MKVTSIKVSMNNKIETTRYGNITLNAEATVELEDASPVDKAIEMGNNTVMKAIQEQKTAIDKAEREFFALDNKELATR